MSRARRRANRIREEIPIQRVLADYGYQVDPSYDGEQQFSCDLHGDGQDNKPSARVYGDSNSAYCFACDRTRDAIEYTREKEGLGFWDALKVLEKRYDLSAMPWEDEDQEEWEAQQKPKAEAIIAAALNPNRTYEEDRKRVKTLLDNTTHDRDLPMRTTLSLWEAFDKVDYLVFKERLTEQAGRAALEKIRVTVMDKLQKATT